MTSKPMRTPWLASVAAAALIAGLAGTPALAAGGAAAVGEQQQMQHRAAGERIDLTRAEIQELQQRLDRQGHDPGPIDGMWGPLTASALEDFQRAQGLPVTGEPDRQTLATLGVTEQRRLGIGEPRAQARDDAVRRQTPEPPRAGVAPDPAPMDADRDDHRFRAPGEPLGERAETVDLTREQVREIQLELQREGHHPGPIDGMWGPMTANALLDYQRAQGLEPTGRPDQQTLAQLGVSPRLGIGEPRDPAVERRVPEPPRGDVAPDPAPMEADREDHRFRAPDEPLGR